MGSKVRFALLIVCIISWISCAHGGCNRKNTGPLPKFTEYTPDQPTLNVHVIAHTHDDVGWLKTVDEYYYGANQSIQFAGVQYILDTVITALQADPARKFIYVEIAFFERWWREQTEEKKEIVRMLIQRGQFEFINGGWCMNDEATTDHSSIIEQMTRGHTFLWNEFQVRPTIGWHIDPFGHAATQASLFAQMGFDAFFFGRIEYDEHALRNATKQLEFVWRGSNSLGKDTQIWSHVLYTDYCYPPGFGFEWGDDPIQDDPDLFDMNIQARCDAFAAEVRKRSLAYRHDNILIPFGCDFQYMNAHMNFKNMDKIIKYINSNPSRYGLKLFYSTPSIYVDAVYKAGLTWDVRTGDFFPYADNDHSFWTGYYTSRAALKGYVRDTNNILHATDKLFTTSAIPSLNVQTSLKQIDVLTQAFSVAQHHDAVSGTEKQHVADDYAKRLSIGVANTHSLLSKMLGHLVNPSASPSFAFCPLINESKCDALEALASGSSVPVVAYNALAWNRTHYFNLPVPTSSVQVLDGHGKTVVSQVYPNQDRSDHFNLVFAGQLPPMGYATFVIKPTQTNSRTAIHSVTTKPTADFIIENENLRVTFSGDTGKLISILNKVLGQTIKVQQDFLWWNASAGNNNVSKQASGAYIFRPNGTLPFAMSKSAPTLKLTTGPLVQEVSQVWNSWAKQVIRLYKGQSHIEFEATVGPIDISDHLGKEVVSRFSTELDTSGLWYTDSEGQEMIERRRNWRPWPYNVTEPIAGNYYPMNYASYIKDSSDKTQFTLVTDRSRGCGSIADGQIETMLHRRLLYDDGRGVGEALNESDIVRTKELLTYNVPVNSSYQLRSLSLLLSNSPVLAFSATQDPDNWLKNSMTTWTPLTGALPHNVHLLDLKTISQDQVILRLSHIYAVNEHPEYSKVVTVDIGALFSRLQIVEMTEMTLSANRPLSELHRLNWKTNSIDSDSFQYKISRRSPWKVELRPMDIRTFVVTFQNM